MGNEAIARGGAESAVGVVAGYPGTPATEIVMSYLEYPWVNVEWSSNEKVAPVHSLGASLCNVRSMAVMKHNGTNFVCRLHDASQLHWCRRGNGACISR